MRVPGRSPNGPLGRKPARMEVTFHPHQAWPLFVMSPQNQKQATLCHGWSSWGPDMQAGDICHRQQICHLAPRGVVRL